MIFPLKKTKQKFQNIIYLAVIIIKPVIIVNIMNNFMLQEIIWFNLYLFIFKKNRHLQKHF